MSNTEYKADQYADDVITLRELILKLQEYWRELWANWKLIGAITLPLLLFMVGKAWLTPEVYPANLTFMVNEDEGGRLGGLSGILGQFGSSSGGGGKFNLDKIVELARSRRIVQQALMHKIKIDGQDDLLANHLIREYHYHEKWKDSELGLEGFLFQDSIFSGQSEIENIALKILYGRMVGDPDKKVEGIYAISYGEDTGIFTISAKSTSEPLSIAIAETLYDCISNFYIEKTIEKQQQTYNIAKAKADSIKALLDSKQYQLLKFDDSSKGLVLRTSESTKFQLQRDLQVYAVAYGEALKNVEYADFALKSATPFFQAIDLPISPITPSGSSKKKALLIGLLLGAFLGGAFVIGRKIYREAMEGA